MWSSQLSDTKHSPLRFGVGNLVFPCSTAAPCNLTLPVVCILNLLTTAANIALCNSVNMCHLLLSPSRAAVRQQRALGLVQRQWGLHPAPTQLPLPTCLVSPLRCQSAGTHPPVQPPRPPPMPPRTMQRQLRKLLKTRQPCSSCMTSSFISSSSFRSWRVMSPGTQSCPWEADLHSFSNYTAQTVSCFLSLFAFYRFFLLTQCIEQIAVQSTTKQVVTAGCCSNALSCERLAFRENQL